MLIGTSRNRDSHPAATRIGANATCAVPFVAYDSLRSQAWASSTAAFDGALFHQRLEHRRFVLLSGCQDQGQQLAVPFGADVDFGRESAAAPA